MLTHILSYLWCTKGFEKAHEHFAAWLGGLYRELLTANTTTTKAAAMAAHLPRAPVSTVQHNPVKAGSQFKIQVASHTARTAVSQPAVELTWSLCAPEMDAGLRFPWTQWLPSSAMVLYLLLSLPPGLLLLISPLHIHPPFYSLCWTLGLLSSRGKAAVAWCVCLCETQWLCSAVCVAPQQCKCGALPSDASSDLKVLTHSAQYQSSSVTL